MGSASGAGLDSASREDALAALRELVSAGARARLAAGVVARLTGVGANELYRGLVEEEAAARIDGGPIGPRSTPVSG